MELFNGFAKALEAPMETTVHALCVRKVAVSVKILQVLYNT